MENRERPSMLRIRGLHISFRTTAGRVNAIRGVDLDLRHGETLAIVGESGSGKSVTMKTVMGILSSNGKLESGTIDFMPPDGGVWHIMDMSQAEIRRELAGKRIAMVFQDPMTSLDPTMSIGAQLTEGMRHHFGTPRREAEERAAALLRRVGIAEAEAYMKSYPHQLSGGMRQRVVIAIALSCSPDVLICDEPTTALDVTIQAKILEMIQDVQRERGLSVIYITHDLGVVAKIADCVNVMYAGKIVESGTVNDIFYDPRHPYTWGLLSSIPDPDGRDRKLFAIPGSPPNLLHPIRGDAFAPRNPYALGMDFLEEPPVFQVSSTHSAATWLLDPRAPRVEMPEELRRRIEAMQRENEAEVRA